MTPFSALPKFLVPKWKTEGVEEFSNLGITVTMNGGSRIKMLSKINCQ